MGRVSHIMFLIGCSVPGRYSYLGGVSCDVFFVFSVPSSGYVPYMFLIGCSVPGRYRYFGMSQL